jgi:hypothetical protein
MWCICIMAIGHDNLAYYWPVLSTFCRMHVGSNNSSLSVETTLQKKGILPNPQNSSVDVKRLPDALKCWKKPILKSTKPF